MPEAQAKSGLYLALWPSSFQTLDGETTHSWYWVDLERRLPELLVLWATAQTRRYCAFLPKGFKQDHTIHIEGCAWYRRKCSVRLRPAHKYLKVGSSRLPCPHCSGRDSHANDLPSSISNLNGIPFKAGTNKQSLDPCAKSKHTPTTTCLHPRV